MTRTSTLFTLLLLLVSAGIKAQLSGTYTVGGATPDYATPIDAANAVVAQGVSGPVVFNIRPGTYSGKLLLTTIAGTSSTNTVTFQAENGDSSSVVLDALADAANTTNYLVNVYGADWVVLRQLTLTRSGTGTYGSVVVINAISIGTLVERCHIVAAFSTSTATNSIGIYSPSGGTSVDSMTMIRNNFVESGSYGIYLAAPNSTFREPQNVIENNIISGCSYQGIHMQDQRAPIVRGNSISPGGIPSLFTGMYLTNIDRGIQVYNNRIDARSSGNTEAIYINGINASAGAEGLIYNNFMSCTGGSSSAGMRILGSSYLNFIYNSVNVYSSPAAVAGVNVSSPLSTSLMFQNNNVASSGVGISTSTGTGSGISSSNYNNWYGVAGCGNFDGTATPTLADWQAASSQDANSVSGDPQYVSNTDLHASSAVVNNNALPVASITTDIDGALRDANTPDMGAAEFTPLSDNVGPVAFTQPKNTSCGNTTAQVSVSIRNYGGLPQSNIPVTVEVTGAVTATLTETYAGPLAPGATDTLTFTQTLNTVAGGTLNMIAYTALSGDQDLANDTISGSADFLAIPNAPTTLTFNYCPGGVITSTTDSGFATFWYDSDTASTPIFVGNTFSPNITSPTTFWAESRQEGAGGCLRITEVALDDPILPGGGGGDFVEIQNLSGLPFDATGWKVIACDGGADINTTNPLTWDLGLFQAGEVQYRSDNSTDNYWGSNLLFNPNASGWIMIIDQNGQLQDYVAWGWTAVDIQNQFVSIAGFNISVGTQWSGDGAVACSAGSSVSRIGSSDNNVASDISCIAYSAGAQNPGLASTFSGCGYGACPSLRVPIQVAVLAPISVNLGSDTTFSGSISLVLDAGAGFTTYLWSDNSTGQALTVTSPGTYWVAVTNSAGCSAIDSIVVSTTVSVPTIDTRDVTLYPNPSSTSFSVRGISSAFGTFTARVLDAQGREVSVQTIKAASTSTLTFDTSGWAEGIYSLLLQGDGLLCHRTLMVSHR